MADSSQKFIARNRAPRVQIEYDVELYGAEKKVQLPFVMGVLSDLSGKSHTKPPSLEQREFLEIDVDNFDKRMRGMAPRVEFSVPNTLTGEGSMPVDITFESMDDFSPAAIARKVEPLRQLLEARTQLSNLMTYMDGKSGAEDLIGKLMADPTTLRALTGVAASADVDTDAALAALRNLTPDTEATEDTGTQDALAALKSSAPAEEQSDTSTSEALASLATQPVADAPEDTTQDALSGLAASAPDDAAPADTTAAALEGLAAAAVAPDETTDDRTDALASLADSAVTDTAETADPSAALDALRDASVDNAPVANQTDDALKGLAAAAPSQTETVDTTDIALAALADSTVDNAPADETSDAALDALRDAPIEDAPVEDSSAAVLDGLAAAAPTEDAPDTQTDDALSALADATVDTPPTEDTPDAALADLAAQAPTDDPTDNGTDAALDGLAASSVVDDTPAEDAASAALDALAAATPDDSPEDAEETVSAALSALADETPPDVPETDDVADALSSLADADIPDLDTSDTTDTALSALADAAVADTPDTDDAADALDALLDGVLEDVDTPDSTVDDALSALAETPVAQDAAADPTDDILSDLVDQAPEAAQTDDTTGDILADLVDAAPADAIEDTDRADALESLLSTTSDDPSDDDGTDDILAELADAAPATDVADDAGADAALAALADIDTPIEDAEDGLDDILNSPSDDATPTPDGVDDLDALLADPDPSQQPSTDTDLDDLEALLSDPSDAQSDDVLSDLDALLADDTPDEADPLADLDALLEDTSDEPAADADPLDDLDALLADDGDASDDDGLADLDALLADDGKASNSDPLADLDDLLGEDDASTEADITLDDTAQIAFGVMSADRPEATAIPRDKFRIAILGDFSGRAANGNLEIGDGLANREPIPFDIDDVEELIQRFATKLVLPLGKDGKGIEVALRELDDLHPDELYENVEIFSEISGMRQRLKAGSMADAAVSKLQEWGAQYGSENLTVRAPSASSHVPADRKLSDFASLIGDVEGRLATPAPASDFIAQIMAPHVVAAPDPGAAGMLEAVDEALSSAMRLILHAPAFQAIEAQWRSLDFLARRVESSQKLELVLYDVSAEEIAADLAAQEDLAAAGITRMLADIPIQEDGPGGFSAVMGMYTFEETPPHAELLARVSRLAAHIDAPFFASMSPEFMKTPRKDRHALVAKAWDDLRAMPEAKYLGLVTPRFMMRRPYGAKTNPVSAFDFEEFTPKAGLKSLLYANPVVAVTVLLAASYTKNGKSMGLGEIMSLGDIPYHFVNDAHGDQVALPCTERNVTTATMEDIVTRGFMPIVSPKGRDEIRLASFQAVGGGEILGPWTNAPRPAPSTAEAPPEASDDSDASGLDDLDLDLDLDLGDVSGGDDMDLDTLLADFGDVGDDSDDDGDMDADLAALLEGL